MAASSVSLATTFRTCAAVLLLLLPLFLCAAEVTRAFHVGFYDGTCPQAEKIVKHAVAHGSAAQVGSPAGLLRLHFHDCFVRGCDASVLLDATPSGEPVEKASPANVGLRGLDIIDFAKQRLEKECPGVVSCADILAFSARDAAVLFGLPGYDVPAGRRDGRTSSAADVLSNLPSPTYDAELLTRSFAAKGFTQRELVTLSGSHSVGGAHCMTFDYRLYGFRPGQAQDPAMRPSHAAFLKLMCPAPGSLLKTLVGEPRVMFEPLSPLTLGASYYAELMKGKGLLQSDQTLMENPNTREMVRDMAARPDTWAADFARAMVKLGSIDVLRGKKGEVRRSCRFVN